MKYNGSTFWHNLSMFPNCRMTTNNSSVYFISANQNKSIIGIPCKNSYVREEFDLEEMYIFDVTEEIPFLWLLMRYIAINHLTRLILVFSKMVPTMAEKLLWHFLQIYLPSLRV